MLVMTRRTGEEIVIGENIHLTVVRVEGGKVRLGIVASSSVHVYRAEIGKRRVVALHSNDTHSGMRN